MKNRALFILFLLACPGEIFSQWQALPAPKISGENYGVVRIVPVANGKLLYVTSNRYGSSRTDSWVYESNDDLATGTRILPSAASTQSFLTGSPGWLIVKDTLALITLHHITAGNSTQASRDRFHSASTRTASPYYFIGSADITPGYLFNAYDNYITRFDSSSHISWNYVPRAICITDRLSAVTNSILFMLAKDSINRSKTILIRSNDLGYTWNRTRADSTDPLVDFQAFNPGVVLLLHRSGSLELSIDSGKTWSQKTAGLAGTFSTLKFSDPGAGLIGGPGGSLKLTLDSGKTWTTQSLNTTDSIEKIFVHSGFVYVTAGKNVYKNNTQLVGLPKPGWEKPADLKIYPNPAFSRVKFESGMLDSDRGATVSISDQLGRIVRKLVISKENREIDIFDLAPGVYEVTLANERVNTRSRLIKVAGGQ